MQRVALTAKLDGLLDEVDRVPGGAGEAGELGGPGAELGVVEPRELVRIGHGVPQCERSFEVGESLCEAEDGVRLARRFDRRGQRLGGPTSGRPVRRDLRWCRLTAGELVGELSVQLLALTWEDRRVDRLRQERVAEAKATAGLIRYEDAVVDRMAK